jgi:dipeptidyl aminopeptidase/acylaminoacyl peptidase
VNASLRESLADVQGPSTVSDNIWYPQHVVCGGDERTVAFVVDATRAGATDRSGLWAGAVDGAPSKLTDEIPSTNLAIWDGPSGSGVETLLYAVTSEDRGECVIRDLATGSEQRIAFDGVPEFVAWSREGVPLLLIAEPGADTASLNSGKPLSSDVPLVRSNRLPIGWRRVWRVDVATGRLELLSPETVSVWEFTPVDGARVAAVISADPAEAGWYRPTLSLLGPTTDDRRDLHVATWQLTSPTVSPDGTRVAFLEGWASDRGLGTGQVREVELEGGAVTNLDMDLTVSATWLRWRHDDRLWFAGWHGLGMSWGWVDSPFTAKQMLSIHSGGGSIVISRWRPQVVPLSAERAVTVHSTVAEPPEVSVLSLDREPTRWSQLNADVARGRGFTVSEVLWEHEGVTLEGLLATPSNRSAPHPLVVDIHGGPSLAYHHSWDMLWAETLCDDGYAVFMPNPYGGPGRGEAFARMNLGDSAGVEFEQILAGVHHLGASDVIDVERTAVMGASYGGYLAAWAVARGVGFRGGIVIAGISNLQSCWGTANNPPFYEFSCGGTPSEQPGLYASRSPVNVVSDGSLPALILHGEQDQCVPVSQARELFATLTSAKVAAELVIYPGEGHQVQRFEYVRDQRRRVLHFLRDIM